MRSGNPQHLRPPTPRAAVMHMGCSPTETKPPRQGPSKPPSALEHPSPEFQPREGHGWLMQQLLPPEPSMVPWALARTGHPTGVTHTPPPPPPNKPRALVLSLGPETKSQTPVGSQKHKSHLHPTAHSPHSIPHRKGHGGGGGRRTHTGMLHPPHARLGVLPRSRSHRPQPLSPVFWGNQRGCQAAPPPQAETSAGVHLQIWPG